eukprot:jgi/Picre1/35298/NNA_002760.t1
MHPTKQVPDKDYEVDMKTDRRIRGRHGTSLRARTETENQRFCSERPRRRATRKTHLQNGDFVLFNDDTGVDDPLDGSFEEHEAMQMSDGSNGHANIRSSSSRSRRRPRRRPRDAEDADYHLEDEEVDTLSDNDDGSGSPAVDYCNPEIARLSNQIFEIEARGRERGREYYDLLLEATKEWDDLCSKTFTEMARYCLCGACELGGSLNPTFVNVQEHRADVEGGKCRAQRNNPTLPGKYTFRNGRGQISEVELLYLRIRHSRPQRVLELASAWGGTTLALLAALNINKDKGTLIGVDVLVEHQLYLHEMRDVLNKYFGKFGFDNKMIRFDFIFGDIKLHLPDINKVPFDYIHVDGDHSAQFAELYTENILDKNQKRYLLSIHDIISCDCNPGRLSLTEEGQVVMDWLELCGDRNDFPKRLFSQCKDYTLHNELQKVRKKVFEGSSVLLNKNESIWSTCQTTQRGDYMSTIYTQVERIQE